MPDTDRIRQLNDELRINFRGGMIAVTPGVMALGDLPTILKQLREFTAFDEGNNVHKERDFGSFQYQGASHIAGTGPLLFFQISYYDKELMMGSPDPAKPELTTRHLVLMLADEY